MRIIVMFDLPVETPTNRKEYRRFRKYLIKSGYMMFQESVYCKLVINPRMGDFVVEDLRRNKPAEGLVSALKVTEKQFSKIEYIAGELKKDVLDTDERVTFL